MFLFAHTDAVYKGLRAGFMDLFVGTGYNFYNSKKINFFSKLGIGSAGGRIYPEGGLIIYPSSGIDFRIFKKIAFNGHIGYYRAIGDDLEALTYGFGFKYINLSGGIVLKSKKEKKYTHKVLD